MRTGALGETMLTTPPSSVVTAEDGVRDAENGKFPTGVSEARGCVAG